MSAIIRIHKNICDTSVREIRIASGGLEGARAVTTCMCTAIYSVKSSDKSMKSVSVQEANITAMVNGMQRYLELSVCRRSQHLDIARCRESDCPSNYHRYSFDSAARGYYVYRSNARIGERLQSTQDGTASTRTY